MPKSLNNPALISAIASSPKGQKVIGDAIEKTAKTVDSTVSIIKNVVLAGFVITVGVIGYKYIFGGFKSKKENPYAPKSNISDLMAKLKADSLYKAMYGAGTDFKAIKSALYNVNYNAFIKIYNQFGERQGIIPGTKKMNLTEWLQSELSNSELIEIRFLIPNHI